MLLLFVDDTDADDDGRDRGADGGRLVTMRGLCSSREEDGEDEEEEEEEEEEEDGGGGGGGGALGLALAIAEARAAGEAKAGRIGPPLSLDCFRCIAR